MAGDSGWAEDSGLSSGSSRASRARWGRRDKDFYWQIEDSAIIGLTEAAEEVCLEAGRAQDVEGDPLQYPSFHRNDLQDSRPPRGDSPTLLLCDLAELGSDSQAGEEDDGTWLIPRRPDIDRQRDMTEDEEEEADNISNPEEFSKSLFCGVNGSRDRRLRTAAVEPEEGNVSPEGCCHSYHHDREVAAVQFSTDSLGESHEGGLLGNTLPPQSSYLPLSTVPPDGAPSHFNGTLVYSCVMDSPGLESDAVTESQSVLETQVESHSGQMNHNLKGRNSPDTPGAESQDLGDSTPTSCSSQSGWVVEQGAGLSGVEADGRPEGADCSHPASWSPKPTRGTPQTPSPSAVQCTRKVWQSPSNHAPCLRGPKGLRTSTDETPRRGCTQDSSRYGIGQLNHPLPDFSKVEPKVRFPKGGYKPPKSKEFKKSPGSKKPRDFISLADVVREVLRSTDSLPQDVCSPPLASSLVHQLQDDYNRVLTKYAEAQNTIDRLRLEAKVNLYSDPPKPCHPDYTGTVHKGSKVMTMILPRAQRVELDTIAVSIEDDPEEAGGSVSLPSTSAYPSPCGPGPRPGESLTEALSRQAGCFHMQVDSFEELLREGKLKPLEVPQGLSWLAQGQGSLERGYLRVREEHRLQQQQGKDQEPLDPHRELEGEIFCLGMRLEELKERYQMGEQVQPVTTVPPLAPLGTDLTMDPAAVSAPFPLSESQQAPDDGDLAGLPVGVAACSAGTGRDGEGETNERQPSPPSCLQRHVQGRGENDLRLPVQQAPEGTRERAQSPSPGRSQQGPLPLCPTFPWKQCQDLRWGGAKSRSSSSSACAAESLAFEDRASEPLSGPRRRAPPQGGLVSPGTDSGFVGSESSHLNLAAPSPAQLEAIASHSPLLEGGGDKMLSVSTHSGLGPACQGLTSTDRSRAVASDSELPPSEGKSRLAPPLSPRPWPISCSSELESESDHPHSSSEGEEEFRSVRHNCPANRQPGNQRRIPLTGLHHPADPSGVQGSDLPADRHMAIQSLQDELSRLGKQLEGSLRRSRPSDIPTVPPSVWEDPLFTCDCCTLYPRFSQYQKDERIVEEGKEEVGEMEEVKREEDVPCERSSPVPHLRPELDISPSAVPPTAADTSKPQSNSTPIPESSRAQSKGEKRAKPVEHGRAHMGHQHNMAASRGPDKVSERRRQSRTLSKHAADDADGNPDGLSTDRTPGSARQDFWPVGSARPKDGCVFLSAPPFPVLGSVPLVQYVPISPSVIHCSGPAPASVSAAPLTHLRPPHLVLDRGGCGGCGARRHARVLSADLESLGDSLTRAIETARQIRATSRRMARSLSSSIRHQGALSLS